MLQRIRTVIQVDLQLYSFNDNYCPLDCNEEGTEICEPKGCLCKEDYIGKLCDNKIRNISYRNGSVFWINRRTLRVVNIIQDFQSKGFINVNWNIPNKFRSNDGTDSESIPINTTLLYPSIQFSNDIKYLPTPSYSLKNSSNLIYGFSLPLANISNLQSLYIGKCSIK